MVAMPTLPGKSLSQAHYDRVVAAFPGATAAEKAESYDRWLTNRLIERVEMVERRRFEEKAAADLATMIASLAASLPQKVQEPHL